MKIVRSYYKSFYSELHDKPRNYLVEDEANLLKVFDEDPSLGLKDEKI